jgi:hypothetical protein
MEFRNILVTDFRSDPLLKHIETTAGRDKYELLQKVVGRFGSMKIFLTCPRRMWSTDSIMVHIIDDGLKT